MVAAVADMSSIGALQGICDDVLQAPAWPLARQSAAQRASRSSATLNDILSSAGLADTSAVHGLLLAWEEIFSRFRPDLLVAEFAPVAALAARGRIPLVQVGNGYTLPPDDMSRFPPLHRLSPPQWNEEDTLSAVNQAALSLGRSQLDRLPQLFSGDVSLVQTFALLDPYQTQRVEEVDGPLLSYVPGERAADATDIFVYLSGAYDVPQSLVSALDPFAGRLRLYAPRLASGQARHLLVSGARVDDIPVPLRDVLASSCLVVHSGGSGVASEALAAGVPQIILSSQIEQTLNGHALQTAGVGRLIEAYDPSATISPDVIAATCADEAMTARAAEAGKWHREYLADKNPALRSERACLDLLGE